MTGALLLALTAGMLGAVNPCGFAMLPAYLSLLVAGPTGGRGAVGRALTATAGLTLGYVVVFGAFGLAVAPVADWLRPRLPWSTVVLGGLLAVAGCWLLAGRRLPTPRPFARAPRLTRSLPSMALFGMAYALTSLSCSIAPFLAIVVTSLRAGSPLRGLALFGAYATGMALVVAVAALGVALLRGRVVARLRGAGAWVPRLSGLVLLVAGGYVAWYGWYEVRLAQGHHDAFGDPVVLAAARVQRFLVAALDAAGPALLAAALAALLVLAGLRRRRRGPAPPTPAVVARQPISGPG
ncbi:MULTISPECIES: cytochrome c biogenesis CcdA family protein [Micromonospora]|uniref:Cytochrome c biogenesis protein CcdA n=1 Tax=Micromonospora solifontis TaxID=2487138 RepID=A0ABX9W8Y9_9ACTN|nr:MULTISPECIES: cytochrome c biogenesis protein CcdA [Micromonospora]NES13898.1 cytochrome c biogenesis protein CcdA [Micromonospora sp. PPF5-17B]NES39503.1 cytochrome c biogenesis protein CcdA [Micromonospora solifontis]NES53998.1 cytochrome c biogenesis protein CcdA [Micromonospora sp. PPF5-6]RNL88563.1 cytochrome c biogenesis protein CcdA [Micromonospora solifontis]